MLLTALGPVIALLSAQSAEIRYFPSPTELAAAPCSEGLFTARNRGAVSDFESKWYSGHLAAAKEPSLYRRARARSPGSTLRFTWLPTFDHPVMVRVEWSASPNGRLLAKELSGQGGYGPGEVTRTVDRAMTPGEADKLKTLLARTRFFDLPVTACDRGMDGSEWLFERTDRRGYRLVKRWSPDKGPVRELGDAMLALTGWKFRSIY